LSGVQGRVLGVLSQVSFAGRLYATAVATAGSVAVGAASALDGAAVALFGMMLLSKLSLTPGDIRSLVRSKGDRA